MDGAGDGGGVGALERWRCELARAFVPLEPAAVHTGAFRAALRATEFDGLTLAEVSGSGQVVRRTAATIRLADPAYYKVGLQLTGHGLLEQDGRQARLDPGDFAIYDTTRPYRLRFDAPFRMLVVMCPRTALPVPARLLGERTAVAVHARDGIGAMVSPFLGGLAQLLDGAACVQVGQPPATPAAEVRAGRRRLGGGHLGTAVLDALAAAFDDDPGPSDSAGALLTRVHDHIERHLGDQDLGPDSIAAAHHISVSYLHKLFARDDETVAGRIRARRLERCRRDLRDPALASRPVSAVAARWGLVNPAHFSRAFRAAYGVSPTTHRGSRMQE